MLVGEAGDGVRVITEGRRPPGVNGWEVGLSLGLWGVKLLVMKLAHARGMRVMLKPAMEVEKRYYEMGQARERWGQRWQWGPDWVGKSVADWNWRRRARSSGVSTAIRWFVLR